MLQVVRTAKVDEKNEISSLVVSKYAPVLRFGS